MVYSTVVEGGNMLGTKDIIKEAASLPVEDRAAIIDGLLRTLNNPDPEVDAVWLEIARHRLSEIRSGKVKTIPGEEVFARIKERYGV